MPLTPQQFREAIEEEIERIAMNIVYQLDDDSGVPVEFRQANNDKRINFVKGLLREVAIIVGEYFVGQKLESKHPEPDELLYVFNRGYNKRTEDERQLLKELKKYLK